MNVAAEEHTLVTAFKAGDLDALGQLVQRHQSAVFAMAFSTTKNQASSEDLTQEAFVQAWAGRKRLSDPSKFRAWVCGIVRNLGRKDNLRRNRTSCESPEEAVDDRPDPLDQTIAQETQVVVAHALEQIPSTYRDVIALYYSEGHSAAEVASALGISEAAVLQRLRRGRKHLKRQVENVLDAGLRRLGPSASLQAAIITRIQLDPPTVPADASIDPLALETIGKEALMKPILAATIALTFAITAVVTWATWPSAPSTSQPAGAPSTNVNSAPVGSVATTPANIAGKQATNAAGQRALPQHTRASEPHSSASEKLAADTQKMPSALQQPTKHANHFTFALRSKNEALWYKLHATLPGCAKRTLPKTLASGLTVSLRFAQDAGVSRMHHVRLNGAVPVPVARQFESCLLQANKDTAFAGGLTEEALTLRPGTAHKAPKPDLSLLQALNIKLGPARGPASARVTLVVYTDFQCPYCAKLLPTIDQLFEAYPKDLQVVKKLFALRPGSRRFAAATVAAGDQGKFWEMHDLIFAHQDKAKLTDADLVSFARQLQLDVVQFNRDRRSQATAEIVQRDIDEGKALGVKGTPTVFINNTRIVGARPIASYRALIDKALK